LPPLVELTARPRPRLLEPGLGEVEKAAVVALQRLRGHRPELVGEHPLSGAEVLLTPGRGGTLALQPFLQPGGTDLLGVQSLDRNARLP
jgi:hypothetical protein